MRKTLLVNDVELNKEFLVNVEIERNLVGGEPDRFDHRRSGPTMEGDRVERITVVSVDMGSFRMVPEGLIDRLDREVSKYEGMMVDDLPLITLENVRAIDYLDPRASSVAVAGTFDGGRRSEGGGQGSEGGSRRSEGGSRRSEREEQGLVDRAAKMLEDIQRERDGGNLDGSVIQTNRVRKEFVNGKFAPVVVEAELTHCGEVVQGVNILSVTVDGSSLVGFLEGCGLMEEIEAEFWTMGEQEVIELILRAG